MAAVYYTALDLTAAEGFQWDSGNARKNEKHGVSQQGGEQVFLNQPLLLVEDMKHGGAESHLHALGKPTRDACFTSRLPFATRAVLFASYPQGRCIERRGRSMPRSLKPIPKFRSQAQERKFWETHDSTDYLDWSKAVPARFPNLKPSTKSISLRLPIDLLERIKVEANRRDVPYQSRIKIWLAEKAS
jgi:predicted DNA binding CopG/RHH family protein/uncharacterized DUF497 family protein